MIEWREDEPKWVQIAAWIRARIADGTYPAGSRVPSQHEIVKMFGVAKGTALKALESLRESGEIYTVSGLGSFVSPKH